MKNVMLGDTKEFATFKDRSRQTVRIESCNHTIKHCVMTVEDCVDGEDYTLSSYIELTEKNVNDLIKGLQSYLEEYKKKGGE